MVEISIRCNVQKGRNRDDKHEIDRDKARKEKDWALWLDCGRECETGNEIKELRDRPHRKCSATSD